MSDIELKGCPCCGTQPFTHIESAKDDIMYGYISCNNPKCGLKMTFTIYAEHNLLNFDGIINGLHDAAERWNKRDGDNK